MDYEQLKSKYKNTVWGVETFGKIDAYLSVDRGETVDNIQFYQLEGYLIALSSYNGLEYDDFLFLKNYINKLNR